MNEIKININERIKVRLTVLGKHIYYHQFDNLNEVCGKEVCKPIPPKEDEDGYTSFQLWEFIELYGHFIGMAKPNVIQPLEIVYQTDEGEGKWDCSTGLPTCTACGKMPRETYIDGSEKWPFCPMCGARMEAGDYGKL